MSTIINVRSTARPTALVECLNVIDNTFAVRYFVEQISVEATEDTPAFDGYEWLEVRLNYCPSPDDCFRIIKEYLEAEEERIMDAGFEWTSPRDGQKYLVSLDEENQRNYQAQYLANVTAGLPLEDTPYYFGLHSEHLYHFSTIEELKEWYARSLDYGARVKAEFIQRRQSINKEDYNFIES